MPETPGTGANETLRSIALGERRIDYHLRRARRRTIGLSIDHRGLRVGAPLRASLSDIENLIRRHAEWVERKLDEWRSRPQPGRLALTDGTQLPFLGGMLTLRLARGTNQAIWSPTADRQTVLTLCLRTPAVAPRLLENTLRARARECFEARLLFFSARLGLPQPPLTLSAARTRWGSCNRRGAIRLNWRLIFLPEHLVDYVVAHEVAHLLEMNHGPRFWQTVGRLYPDYQAARNALRHVAADIPQGFAAPAAS